MREPIVVTSRKSNGVPATARGGPASGIALRIDREEAIRGKRQPVIKNIRVRQNAVEIEKAVVGEIDDGRTIGARGKGQRQFGGTGQSIRHAYIEPARIALLAIGADIAQRHGGLSAILDRADLPELLVETVQPAVQRVRAVVGRELKRLAVEPEARIGNAIGVAADRGAEEAASAEIAGEIVMAEHDVVAAAVRIRHQQRLQRGAQRDDARLKAVRCRAARHVRPRGRRA